MESVSPADRSPLLDISILKAEFINPKWTTCLGYLDTVLQTFKRHNHPFVLVSTLAMRWSGANNAPQKEIDVLVRSSHLNVLVDSLVESNDWVLSENYAEMEGGRDNRSLINNAAIRDVWLKSCLPNPLFEYIRFWPEELYHLSVDCKKIEVPDVSVLNCVVLEEEYYRDKYERFGPPLLEHYEKHNLPLLPPLQERAKYRRRRIPIYIPTIEDHLNAFLDQMREQHETRCHNGGVPSWQINNYIRCLYLDWDPTRTWLLSTKIRARNRELMKERLDKFQREPLLLYLPGKEIVINLMPWEQAIKPEFKHLLEQDCDGKD